MGFFLHIFHHASLTTTLYVIYLQPFLQWFKRLCTCSKRTIICISNFSFVDFPEILFHFALHLDDRLVMTCDITVFPDVSNYNLSKLLSKLQK